MEKKKNSKMHKNIYKNANILYRKKEQKHL